MVHKYVRAIHEVHCTYIFTCYIKQLWDILNQFNARDDIWMKILFYFNKWTNVFTFIKDFSSFTLLDSYRVYNYVKSVFVLLTDNVNLEVACTISHQIKDLFH